MRNTRYKFEDTPYEAPEAPPVCQCADPKPKRLRLQSTMICRRCNLPLGYGVCEHCETIIPGSSKETICEPCKKV